MGGGLMQLVAYGAQDIYLTGNPQITFFKVVYRRHTNFAVESIEQTYNGTVGSGKKISVTVSRNGDLLSRVWLQLGSNAANKFSAIDYVECEIGGQVIDKQYGDWMSLWVDLTHNKDQYTMLTNVTANNGGYIPLQFWFCRNPGLALPLIALQYHEVKLNVAFSSTISGTDCTVWCDYIFLDTDERRRFAQVSHEYLIEQTQFSNKLSAGSISVTGVVNGATPSTKDANYQTELRFNHPVKELVWTLNSSRLVGSTTTNADITVDDAVLQLNGHDRFKKREGKYFTSLQRYQHHSGSSGNTDIHVYSFALKPEEHQPSGTCNFSRIDNAVLNLNYTITGAESPDSTAANGDLTASNTVRVYAVNYNVLRIMSGMGGLAYSN